jgi:hypothetical protein
MNKKKLIPILLLSAIAVAGIVLCTLLVVRHYKTKSDGTIEITLVELNGNIKSDKKIDYQKNDALVDLLKNNYSNVVVDKGMLMSIDTFTTASDWSTFISIYVDNEMSQVGILDIQYENYSIISFRMTEYIQP